MKYTFLSEIKSPADLKKLDMRQLENLCEEIREFLIDNVSKTGGHLASNLGVVELTVAIHRQLNSPKDVVIFDVGHQCYVHKMLTGRQAGFEKLRMDGGMSGFPSPEESEHDAFIAGHGSTAIAAAVGIARAKILKQEPGYVIAIVGDGALTGGMVYEALNNAGDLKNLIVILNDNKMSISKNGGGLAHYLSDLRVKPGYYRAKSDVKSFLNKTPIIGVGVKKVISSVKSMMRREFSTGPTLFDDMGLRYIGPMDGHDLNILCGFFASLNKMSLPLLVHTETIKGKGFFPAENNPGAFHGVSAFDRSNIPDPDMPSGNTYSNVFGHNLYKLGKANRRLCGVVAAMTYGTGMQYFKKAYRDRFFDVGMAEEMAVTFAAGLARGGMLPVVAIYSTFLQRAYDQIIHDVVLQNLDIVFAIDRAGLVPADGGTHQGIYDVAYLSQQKDFSIISPANYEEMNYWLSKVVDGYSGPRAIRYPRGTESEFLKSKKPVLQDYDWLEEKIGAKGVFISYGIEIEEVLKAKVELEKNEILADVCQMMLVNPININMLEKLLGYEFIVFAEEGIKSGGAGEHLLSALHKHGYKGYMRHIALPSRGISHATVEQLKKQFGLDFESLVQAYKQELQELKNEA